MARLWQTTRSKVQSWLYWLGPTYCILIGSGMLFFSFLMQLLTSVGVPFIKSFHFLRFDLENFSFVVLGMWAACTGQQAVTFPSFPQYNQPEQFNCPPPSWGWKTLQYGGITNAFFDHVLPKVLILHPIACFFTLCALIASLVTIRRKRSYFILPIFSFLSCLFALLSFFIDVATFVPARHKLMSPNGTATLGLMVTSTTLGPAFWLSLATFCVDIIGNSFVIFGYSIWRYQRTSLVQRRSGAYSNDMESKGEMQKSRRGYRAQDSVTSFTDATSTANGRNSRRGLSETEDDNDVFGDDKAANDSTEMTAMGSSDTSPKPLSAARLSNDYQSRRVSEDRRSGRSEGRRSIGGLSSYEDASTDAGDLNDDDDARSTRSVYEDAPSAEVPTAPAHVGSRGFLRRKPVEQY